MKPESFREELRLFAKIHLNSEGEKVYFLDYTGKHLDLSHSDWINFACDNFMEDNKYEQLEGFYEDHIRDEAVINQLNEYIESGFFEKLNYEELTCNQILNLLIK